MAEHYVARADIERELRAIERRGERVIAIIPVDDEQWMVRTVEVVETR